jgi:hypothetical protein
LYNAWAGKYFITGTKNSGRYRNADGETDRHDAGNKFAAQAGVSTTV